MKGNDCKNNCCCGDIDGDLVQKNFSETFLRVVEEKNDLDERIMKLKAFIDSFKEYEDLVKKVGSYQAASAINDQLDTMVQYSNLLNTRIVLWKD